MVTLSDKASAGQRVDASGPELQALLRGMGAEVGDPVVIPDDQARIEEVLRGIADAGEIDLILTTGGTGLAPRDRTPEATRVVADRLAPGFVEAMRASSLEVTPHAHAEPGGGGGAGEDSDHQHARQSQSLPRAFRGDRARAGARGRDAAGRSLRVRGAGPGQLVGCRSGGLSLAAPLVLLLFGAIQAGVGFLEQSLRFRRILRAGGSAKTHL